VRWEPENVLIGRLCRFWELFEIGQFLNRIGILQSATFMNYFILYEHKASAPITRSETLRKLLAPV